MTSSSPGRYQRVRFLDAAVEDLRSIASRSPAVLFEVLRQLKLLDEGRLRPRPLQDFAKTGDLTDCGKLIVALDGEPEYRIVVREIDGSFHVWEVIVVEDRSSDLPYLLAGLRLGRISDPVRRSDTQRRVFSIRKFLDDR